MMSTAARLSFHAKQRGKNHLRQLIVSVVQRLRNIPTGKKLNSNPFSLFKEKKVEVA